MYDHYGDWPSVVGFAEVENRFVLKQLLEQTPLAKLGYDIVHRDSPDSRGIDVALIYRQDVVRILSVEALPVLTGRDRPTRDILHVEASIDADGLSETMHMFVNHWPSKFGGEEYSRPFRQAASDTLGRAIEKLHASVSGGTPFVVAMGDFNDTPDSAPVRSLVLATGLNNPAMVLQENGKGTLKYNGKWEMIDLFLFSGDYASWEMEIYTHPMLLEKDEKYLGSKPKRSFYGPMWNNGASDHLPIVLLPARKEVGKK